MKIRADFSQREVVLPTDHEWVRSPMAGVERVMLDRVGDEVARATSLVRYAPGSRFETHEHAKGEEFLVLDGTFSDENGDYPAGTYVRNPPGTQHAPFSADGCTIFVKLRQFDDNDLRQFSVDTGQQSWRPGLVDGLSVMPLHSFEGENVALVRWEPGTVFSSHMHFGGEEILVLEGVFEDEFGQYPKGSWLRNPHQSRHSPRAPKGALIWVKTGHLPL